MDFDFGPTGSLLFTGTPRIVSSAWSYFAGHGPRLTGTATVPWCEASGLLVLGGEGVAQVAVFFGAVGRLLINGLSITEGSLASQNGVGRLEVLSGVASVLVHYQYSAGGSDNALLLMSGIPSDLVSSGWTYYAGDRLSLVTGVAMVPWCEGSGNLLLLGSDTQAGTSTIRAVGQITLSGLLAANATYLYSVAGGRVFRIMGIAPDDATIQAPASLNLPFVLQGPKYAPLPPKTRPSTFAYSETASRHRRFDPRNAAYIPEITARQLVRVRQGDAPQDTAGKVVYDPNR